MISKFGTIIHIMVATTHLSIKQKEEKMKNLMNVAIVLFTVALFTGTMFGQQGLGDGTGNPDAPRLNWVDLDGDGVCDNFGTDLQGSKSQLNKGTGLGDGTGAGFGDGSGLKPQDGTGFGRKGYGSSDGTSILQKGSSRRTN